MITDLKIKKDTMESVHNNPHKFLGSLVPYTNTSKEYFQKIYKVLEEKIINIHYSTVKGENKLVINERHALPSLRYHLSIHDMTKIH